MRLVRTAGETVTSWLALAAEAPTIVRVLVGAVLVLIVAASWRLVRGSR